MLSWLFGNGNAALVKQRRGERDALIDEARKLVPEHDDKVCTAILSSDVEHIVLGIKEKRWTGKTVVEVFIRQAILAHDTTNCLTEVNFDAALKKAEEHDAHFAKTGELVGPLHAVPFSLKDHYSLKGKRSVTGYTEWFKKEPEKEDCTLARVVQHYGAVCIAKTNVPQTMLNFECRNYAYGQTTNPYSKAHTAGGSSGGEAALLAMDGAAFGFGSDIGGSLRIPTSYCGIYAIKPSNGRGWPRAGNIDIGPSPLAITSVAGPMCRSAADLELLTTLFADALTPSNTQSLRDVQLRFGDEVEALYPLRSTWFDPLATAAARKADANVAAGQRKTLRIGYYRCDGFTKTSPPCLRAVDLAVKALQSVKGKDGAKAIELVEVDPSRLQTFETLRRFVGLTSITAYEHLTRHLGPDPVDPALKVTLALPRYPVLRWIVGLVARYILGDRQLPKIFAESNKRKASVYFAHQYEQKKMQRRFEKEVWNQLDLDAIVCPVQASPALPHYGSTLLAPLAASTILYNVLGNPVTVVPVTRVDSSLDAKSNWEAPKGTETCSTMVTTRLHKNFDPTSQHGLPIAVQIVTRDYEDEYAIGLAKVLDDALAAQDGNHRKQFGPGAWQRYTSSNR